MVKKLPRYDESNLRSGPPLPPPQQKKMGEAKEGRGGGGGGPDRMRYMRRKDAHKQFPRTFACAGHGLVRDI